MTDVADDQSNTFLQSREIDHELEADIAAVRDAGMHEKHRGFMDQVQEFRAAYGKAAHENGLDQPGKDPITNWVMDLPRNITVGVMDAARSALDFTDDAAEALEKDDPAGVGTAVAAPFRSAQWAGKQLGLDTVWNDLRGELARGSSGSDELTQSAAQFFIPFTAFSKAVKGGKVAKAVLADAATMATAFEPHEARFADLLRLADTDNSLVNAYIDYMSAEPTSPAEKRGQVEVEGEWEGRFKNVVDSFVSGLAISGVIMAGAKAFKSSRAALAKAPKGKEAASAANP